MRDTQYASQIQYVRGCRDLLTTATHAHNYVIKQAAKTAKLAGFLPVSTPILEETRLFDRSLGKSSDVVGKEMYRFITRGGEEISLRPEGTAGLVRAYFNHGLAQEVPLRYFYAGPMFRYERPQKGRMRQFHQIGVELIGTNRDSCYPGVLAELEIIALGANILQRLGLLNRVTLHINTLGSCEDRQGYHNALKEYFTVHKNNLSEDSQRRLYNNPLRILDSKDPSDRLLLINAPRIEDYLSVTSQTHFRQVCQGLKDLNIEFIHDQHLVRGLDYYEHITFEFVSQDIGAQSTVLGGGCYDRLFEIIGGKFVKGVGFAAGIERLVTLCQVPSIDVFDCVLVPIDIAAEAATISIAQQFRCANISVIIIFSGKFKSRMKLAYQSKVNYIISYSDKDLQSNEFNCKHIKSKCEQKLSLHQIINKLKNKPKTNPHRFM